MSMLCHAFDVSHDGRNKPKPQANGNQASKKADQTASCLLRTPAPSADGASQACPFCRYLVIGEPKRPPINISGKIETTLTPRGFPAAKSIQPETA